MKRFLLLISFFFALLASADAGAQTFSDAKQRARSSFYNNRKSQQSQYERYRSLMNAEFAEYMRKPWEKKEAEEPVVKPKEEPDVPPVVVPDEVEVPDGDEIIIEEVIVPVKPEPAPEPAVPILSKPVARENVVKFPFYGTMCSVRYNMSSRPKMKGSDEKAAADFWDALSGDVANNLIADCLSLREKMSLGDWAYYQLVDNAASMVYGSGSNEASMLLSYVMSQSGYQIRMGRDSRGRIHMLLASDDDVFGKTYFNLDGRRYYIFDDFDGKSLDIFNHEFPHEKAMRLKISSTPKFSSSTSTPRTLASKKYAGAKAEEVVVNTNLIDFYASYPASYSSGNKYSEWAYYANAPLGAEAKASLYPALRSGLRGSTEEEAINALLNFVQTAFEYKTDDDCWGRERVFFADETLYYPYCDCEDRSILFSRLVRDLTGMDVVLLYYPGHIASAVAFSDSVSGDYVVCDNKRYTICDPTYIGAPAGLTMPGMDNKKAVVIKLK